MDRRAFLSWLSRGAAGAAAVSLPAAEQAAASPVTVLTGATVLDGSGAPPRDGATVVLAGDRILAVTGQPPPTAAGVRVIDLAGRFVLPGLWDLHTHETAIGRTFPPMALVHGVTSVRDMRGSAATHDVRRRVERGELAGPRMIVASNLIDGPDSWAPISTKVGTPAEARAAVRESVSEGADLIKVYTWLERDTYPAIAAEAHRLGVPFAGHLPNLFAAHEAVELGQRSIEHMYGMHLWTSSRMPQLYERIAAMPDDPADPGWWGSQVQQLERAAVADYSPRRTAELAGLLTDGGTWHVPTLAIESRYSRHPTWLLDDPETQEFAERYVPRSAREEWTRWVRAWPPWSPEREAREREYHAAKLRLVGDLGAADGPLATGTDSGAAFVFPGPASHDELELLVRAGLSPARALRAATLDAARCAGRDRVSGTVTAGKQADLLVLDADPLADIRNTRRIHAVVTRGRYLGPPERGRILAGIERAAQEEGPRPAGCGCRAHPAR